MFSWQPYYDAFSTVTLRRHGDPAETEGCVAHNLDRSFDQYEALWHFHVVPATNRPVDCGWRPGISIEVERIGRLSYGVWLDVLNSCKLLIEINKGKFGDGYRNCIDSLKNGGDALQKFSDLQEAVEGPKKGGQGPGFSLAQRLNRAIPIFTANDWTATFGPWRERNVGYRNFLTHEGSPPVVVKEDDGKTEHFVLKRDFVVRGKRVNWMDLESRFRANPSQWDRIQDVCQQLHDDMIKWLNDAYRKLNSAMHPLLGDQHYRTLWGWDLSNGPGVPPATFTQGGGNGFMSGVTSVQYIRSNTQIL